MGRNVAHSRDPSLGILVGTRRTERDRSSVTTTCICCTNFPLNPACSLVRAWNGNKLCPWENIPHTEQAPRRRLRRVLTSTTTLNASANEAQPWISLTCTLQTTIATAFLYGTNGSRLATIFKYSSATLIGTQANGPLTNENVFDYFATSMFYDKQSNNQVLRMQTMHTGVPLVNEAEELRFAPDQVHIY